MIDYYVICYAIPELPTILERLEWQRVHQRDLPHARMCARADINWSTADEQYKVIARGVVDDVLQWPMTPYVQEVAA